MSHASEGVTPLLAHLIRDVFVASGKRDWLEGDGLDFVDILRGELDDLTNGVVVDVVNDRYDQRNLDAHTGEVLDGPQLHIKQVTHTPVFVLLFTDTVKLQVDSVLSGRFGSFAELNVFGKTNAVGGCEDAIETDLLGVRDCLQ